MGPLHGTLPPPLLPSLPQALRKKESELQGQMSGEADFDAMLQVPDLT
jgi:hypothetical protein